MWKSSVLFLVVAISALVKCEEKIKTAKEFIELSQKVVDSNEEPYQCDITLESDIKFDGTNQLAYPFGCNKTYCVTWSGKFNGKGYKIKNLTMTRVTQENEKGTNRAASLFGIVKDATFDDVHFSDTCHVTGKESAMLIWKAEGEVTIKSVKTEGKVDGADSSGLVHSAQNLTMQNCKNSGEVNGIHNVAGLVGKVEGKLELSESSNKGTVTITEYYSNSGVPNILAGLIGRVETESVLISRIDDCVNQGSFQVLFRTTDTSIILGGIVGEATGALFMTSTRNEVNFDNLQDVGFKTVAGIVGSASGETSLMDCHNSGNFKLLRATENIAGLVGSATGELNLTGCVNTGSFEEVNYRESALDGLGGLGGNCKISKVINCTNRGNFKRCNGGNLGGIFGYAQNKDDSNITECYNYGNIEESSSNSNTGGIAGSSAASIIQCINEGHISNINNGHVGGIAGSSGEIVDCTNRGQINNINDGGFVGGIAGNSSGKIENCNNHGRMNDISCSGIGTESGMIGGIVGKTTQNVTNSHNYERLNNVDAYYVGGVAGTVTAGIQFTSCTNKGHIDLKAQGVTTGTFGGIVGQSSVDIVDCNNTGHIMNVKDGVAGGIAGEYTGSEIDRSHNFGSIEGDDATIGGVVGQATRATGATEIKNCSNSGNLKASTDSYTTNQVAGLVAKGDSVTVTNCMNFGSITHEKGYANGLVGSEVMIRNSVNLGEVQGAIASGCCRFVSEAINVVNIGRLKGSIAKYGLWGTNTSSIDTVNVFKLSDQCNDYRDIVLGDNKYKACVDETMNIQNTLNAKADENNYTIHWKQDLTLDMVISASGRLSACGTALLFVLLAVLFRA